MKLSMKTKFRNSEYQTNKYRVTTRLIFNIIFKKLDMNLQIA